jgi:stress-induced morphogen
MQQIINQLRRLQPKLILGYGSKYTNVKKGINKISDLDLIIVSNQFDGISYNHRKEIIKNMLGKNFDTINLTIKEYNDLLDKKSSVVLRALKEGKIIYENGRNNL